MYAVVVNVSIGDPESAQNILQEQVVPRVAEQQGFLHGFWTRKGDNGLSMTLWESEDAANQASERVRAMAPETVTVEDIEVREVVAHA
jgi:heme-degrading monooxygenase HmoA